MMCPTDQSLQRFHDDELSPHERTDVAGHLQSCDACAAKVQELGLLRDMIRSSPLPTIAVAALDRWHRNAMGMQERSVRRLAGWMTAAASIALVVSLYAATASQAQATAPSVSEWEAAVIGIDVETISNDLTTAEWIATDLSRTPSGRKP